MIWLTRVTGLASVVSGLAIATGMFFPSVESGTGRAVFISFLIGLFTWINFRGMRLSANVISFLTVGKLVPLLSLILVWLFSQPGFELPGSNATLSSWGSALLLLVFMFGGYDVIPVPAGEVKAPTRVVPQALMISVVFVSSIFILLQLVAESSLPGLVSSKTPLADAGGVLLGTHGALFVAIGSILAMAGNNMGQVLTGSRELYGMAAQGDLPKALKSIHSKYRTPANAILITAVAGWLMALSGSFVILAMSSAMARLVVYVGTAGSVIRLRQLEGKQGLRRAEFCVPLGSLIPVIAIAASVVVMLGASQAQFAAGLGALTVGSGLYYFGRRTNR